MNFPSGRYGYWASVVSKILLLKVVCPSSRGYHGDGMCLFSIEDWRSTSENARCHQRVSPHETNETKRVSAYHRWKNPSPNINFSLHRPIKPLVLDNNYVNHKNLVIKGERRILKELGFCVHVKHPHKVSSSFLWPRSVSKFIKFNSYVYFFSFYRLFRHTFGCWTWITTRSYFKLPGKCGRLCEIDCFRYFKQSPA